ncbi:MAG: hypothetical protein WAK17_09400 [Candidatus Nitrosopolaris sp.]
MNGQEYFRLKTDGVAFEGMISSLGIVVLTAPVSIIAVYTLYQSEIVVVVVVVDETFSLVNIPLP